MKTQKDSHFVNDNPCDTKLGKSCQISKARDFLDRKTCIDIWRFLLLFRCINALLIQTFFQPDEFYQSLEPAWEMAFGAKSGAWITWEWQNGLRSSLHPLIFAIVYSIADKLTKYAVFVPSLRSIILTKIPYLLQAYFAATADFYTWQLSEKIYGRKSNVAWVTLFISVLSPWHWFCSTRTFSNSLEMSLTIMALNFWPWELFSKAMSYQISGDKLKESPISFPDPHLQLKHKYIKELRFSLLLAGTASILRPTNLLVWFSTLAPHASFLLTRPYLLSPSKINLVLLREFLICSFLVLIVSAISDRLYFSDWIFPPYRWLHFNIVQDLAVFYGYNRWHYYFSEGLPQLLTTYFPFTLLGIWRALSLPSASIRFSLTVTTVVSVVTLSLVSHKEVRFIYPLLPILHILTAPSVTAFFICSDDQKKLTCTTIQSSATKSDSLKFKIRHLFILKVLISVNLLISFYFTAIHQSGVHAVVPFIRKTFENNHIKKNDNTIMTSDNDIGSTPYLAILMPCHSTPFRSELVHSDLKAWALTCSPPLDIPSNSQARANYQDEADRFYDDPARFLREEVGVQEERRWPLFVVGFEGIGKVLKEVWESEGGINSKLLKKKSFFNSHWHEDYRRKGDVVVWELVRGQV